MFAVVQKTLDHITEALARGGRVEIREFGVFEMKNRPFLTTFLLNYSDPGLVNRLTKFSR